MILVTLLCAMLLGPVVAIAAAWLLHHDDDKLGQVVFTVAGMWYVSLFGITGVIYIFNTLTTISTYGK
jgi:predicted permease